MSGRLAALSAAREELSSGRRCRLPAGRALQLAGEVLAVAAGLKPALLCDCGAAGAAQWRRYLSRLREAGLLRQPLHVLGLGGSVLLLHPRLVHSRVGAVLSAHPAPFVDVSAARRSPALCGQEEAEAIRGHLAALLGHLRAACPVSDVPASSSCAPCSPTTFCSLPSNPASSIPASFITVSSNPASSISASFIPASSITVSSSPTSSNPASSISASSNLTFSNPASSITVSSNPTSSNPTSSISASSSLTFSNPASSNPASSIPASTNPMPSNPASSNPASSIPASSSPASSSPASSNPMPSNNVSSNPASSFPTSSNLTFSNPTSFNPMPCRAMSSTPTLSNLESSSSTPSCPTSSSPASLSPVSSSEVVPTDWNLCTVAGVLLGYPAAYTFATEEGGENCLAMTPLRVFTVRAACPRIKDGLVVQIYSFSIPERLCSELKEVLDAWREELKGAFRAQSDFVDLCISSEVVTLPAVAL